MRREKIAAWDRLDMADIAAVWPASAQIAPIPIPEVEAGAWESPARHMHAAPGARTSANPLVAFAYVALAVAFAASALTGIF